MIVNDFNLIRARIGPVETDPILFIEPDAMLPSSVSPQFLQSIPCRNHEIL